MLLCGNAFPALCQFGKSFSHIANCRQYRWSYVAFFAYKLDATAKSPKNAAKTTATLQIRGGKVLLTLASYCRVELMVICTIYEIHAPRMGIPASKTTTFCRKATCPRTNGKFQS